MALRKVNKANSVNNIISLPSKDGDAKLYDRNYKNVLSSYYFNGTMDPKLTKKFIKSVESTIRRSPQYSEYIYYLSTTQNLTVDVYNGNISSEMATTEFHHYPFTLYDIVEIIVNKHIHEKDQYTTFDIAEEVLRLHFENLIGLVKLTKTNHELVHAGKIFIPLDSVFGKVNTFTEIYKQYMFSDQIDKFNEIVENTKQYNKQNVTENVLKLNHDDLDDE